MFKKVVASILIITISVLCLPVFSSASVAVYSDLPEPVPTDNCQYFVISINGAMSLYMISSDFGELYSSASIVNDRVVITVIINNESATGSVTLTSYNLNANTLRSSSFNVSLISGFGTYTFTNFPISSNEVLFSSYGVALSDGFNLQPCNVVWNDNTNPATYTTWLQSIFNKLNEVDSNTDDIELRLKNIYDELLLFYSAFSIYQQKILGDTSSIVNDFDDLLAQVQLYLQLFNSFSSTNNFNLTLIKDLLFDIYRLLAQSSEPRDPAIGNQDEVNNVLQNEAALNKDFSSDLNQQFNIAGNIFDGNSAFSFISNLFQNLILSIPSLNSLIIFSLAIGLCVLILGRRLNA